MVRYKVKISGHFDWCICDISHLEKLIKEEKVDKEDVSIIEYTHFSRRSLSYDQAKKQGIVE
jgi:hypothetical protein